LADEDGKVISRELRVLEKNRSENYKKDVGRGKIDSQRKDATWPEVRHRGVYEGRLAVKKQLFNCQDG
jgi:hypothetical protein